MGPTQDQPKKKRVCNHENALTLYKSSVDGKFFFHCPNCRTVIGPEFSTRTKAENWAAKNNLPRYTHERT